MGARENIYHYKWGYPNGSWTDGIWLETNIWLEYSGHNLIVIWLLGDPDHNTSSLSQGHDGQEYSLLNNGTHCKYHLIMVHLT